MNAGIPTIANLDAVLDKTDAQLTLLPVEDGYSIALAANGAGGNAAASLQSRADGSGAFLQADDGGTGNPDDDYVYIQTGANGSLSMFGGSIDLGGVGLAPLVLMLNALPVADPHHAGQVWNDAGTLKVSAG